MDKTSPYYRQVALLVRALPYVANETCFALKGGTAINLFIRDFPRLSVDIDLAYTPLESREVALPNVREALTRIVGELETQAGLNAVLQTNNPDEMRIIAPRTTRKLKSKFHQLPGEHCIHRKNATSWKPWRKNLVLPRSRLSHCLTYTAASYVLR